jgi:hypothetical protein
VEILVEEVGLELIKTRISKKAFDFPNWVRLTTNSKEKKKTWKIILLQGKHFILAAINIKNGFYY